MQNCDCSVTDMIDIGDQPFTRVPPTRAGNMFAVVGVESTGKSTCAAFLTEALNGRLIEEYARLYLEEHSNTYNHEDFLEIAKGQAYMENHAMETAAEGDILVFDTDYIVIYVWSMIVFNNIPQWITNRIEHYPPKVYFLMTPEVEWVNDGLREYPDLEVRESIHRIYIEVLEKFNCKYFIISGPDYRARQEKALQLALEEINKAKG